jgi:enoyl-CoA hydratase/carnithine racemase
MTSEIKTAVDNGIGYIELDRPRALNALSLSMIRSMTAALEQWHGDNRIRGVVLHSRNPKALCAGGDIRFFHQAALAPAAGGGAAIEDFFTEEYALNHLVHHYPKPYVAIMDGIVMGGGMGIVQAASNRLGIVTERTRVAMPEVHIGLFPDVGGSYFLSRAPGQLGTYLGLTGDTIGAGDVLYCGLADRFVPADRLPDLFSFLATLPATADLRSALDDFAAPFAVMSPPASLLQERTAIDRLFNGDGLGRIVDALNAETSDFAKSALARMRQASPLMLAVTLAQLRRGAGMNIGACLRMERGMVRRCFERGEVVEGIRARVIDKDNAPQWNPASIADVTPHLVNAFFDSPWPARAHPLRDLD